MAKEMNFNIELTEEQQKTIFAVVLFVGAFAYIYWSYFWVPTAERIEKATKSIESVEGKIANDEKRIVKLPRLKKEKEELEARAAKEEGKLPRDARTPEFIYTLNDAARRNGLRVSSIGQNSMSTRQYVIEHAYQLAFTGRYHNLAEFMAEFGMYERIFSMRNLTLSFQAPTKEAPEATVRGQVTLVAYQYKG